MAVYPTGDDCLTAKLSNGDTKQCCNYNINPNSGNQMCSDTLGFGMDDFCFRFFEEPADEVDVLTASM